MRTRQRTMRSNCIVARRLVLIVSLTIAIAIAITVVAVTVTAFLPPIPVHSTTSRRRNTLSSAAATEGRDTEATEATSSSFLTSTTITTTNQPPPPPPLLPTLFPALARSLQDQGFHRPTPIQDASAIRALQGENLLLIAPTGSGKTFAYLLPALERILQQQRQQHAQKTILVVAPTRELALQLMRDTTSLLSPVTPPPPPDDNADDDNTNHDEHTILLAVKGVNIPTTAQLHTATVLIGTPTEVCYVLTEVQGGQHFIAGDVLSTCILDEVDVLFPNPPKKLRTKLDTHNKDTKKKKQSSSAFNASQDERRRQEQRRKLRAAKRQGIEFSSTTTTHIVGPTERVLQLIASRRLVTTTTTTAAAMTTPCQILAGSATASRKTLDRLNHALYASATAASSTLETVWEANVQRVDPTNPTSSSSSSSSSSTDNDNNTNTPNDDAENPPAPLLQPTHTHTIRAVTVPPQVTHRYVRLDKQAAQSPLAVLTAVAQATQVLHSKRAILFLCGEFRTAQHAVAQPTSAKRPKAAQQQPQSRGRQQKKMSLQQKKKRAIATAAAASHAKRQATGLSARKACAVLHDLGLEAQPLHVVLGLEQDHRHPEAATADQEEDDQDDDALPPVLVTFENSARGLHLEDIDTVFVVGRPSSAASYLHLAGRVGRYSSSGGIRPGHVISFCTKGSATELTKWTKQVGGTDLEELSLV